jgi:hypothetical protein
MGLPEGVSFDQVIPLLAISFGSQGHVEDAVLAEFSDELYETPSWRLEWALSRKVTEGEQRSVGRQSFTSSWADVS